MRIKYDIYVLYFNNIKAIDFIIELLPLCFITLDKVFIFDKVNTHTVARTLFTNMGYVK